MPALNLASLDDKTDEKLFFAFVVVAVISTFCWLVIRALRISRENGIASGDGEAVSIKEWHARGLGVQHTRGLIVEFEQGLRCPVCHDVHRPTADGAVCDACGAVFHLECVRGLGRCSTLGCVGLAPRANLAAKARSAS